MGHERDRRRSRPAHDVAPAARPVPVPGRGDPAAAAVAADPAAVAPRERRATADLVARLEAMATRLAGALAAGAYAASGHLAFELRWGLRRAETSLARHADADLAARLAAVARLADPLVAAAPVLDAPGAGTAAAEAAWSSRAAALAVDRAKLKLPETPVGHRATPVPLRVTNHGPVPVELGDVRATDARTAAVFPVHAPALEPIAPGAAVELAVGFAPDERRMHRGTLQILDAAGAVAASVAVRGRGVSLERALHVAVDDGAPIAVATYAEMLAALRVAEPLAVDADPAERRKAARLVAAVNDRLEAITHDVRSAAGSYGLAATTYTLVWGYARSAVATYHLNVDGDRRPRDGAVVIRTFEVAEQIIKVGTREAARARTLDRMDVAQVVVDMAQYAAGFLIGAFKGAGAAVIDVATGAADMVRSVATLLFNAIFDDWTAVYETFAGWVRRIQVLIERRGELAAELGAKWNAANDWDRGLYQGEVLGWVMMTVAIAALTMGGSLAASSGRFANVLRALQQLSALGDAVAWAKAIRKPEALLAHAALPGAAPPTAAQASRARAAADHAAEIQRRRDDQVTQMILAHDGPIVVETAILGAGRSATLARAGLPSDAPAGGDITAIPPVLNIASEGSMFARHGDFPIGQRARGVPAPEGAHAAGEFTHDHDAPVAASDEVRAVTTTGYDAGMVTFRAAVTRVDVRPAAGWGDGVPAAAADLPLRLTAGGTSIYARSFISAGGLGAPRPLPLPDGHADALRRAGKLVYAQDTLALPGAKRVVVVGDGATGAWACEAALRAGATKVYWVGRAVARDTVPDAVRATLERMGLTPDQIARYGRAYNARNAGTFQAIQDGRIELRPGLTDAQLAGDTDLVTATFGDGTAASVDGVVASTGQVPTLLDGMTPDVMRFQMVIVQERVVALEAVDPVTRQLLGIRIVGAQMVQFTKSELEQFFVSVRERDKFMNRVSRQSTASDVPADSFGVPGSIYQNNLDVPLATGDQ